MSPLTIEDLQNISSRRSSKYSSCLLSDEGSSMLAQCVPSMKNNSPDCRMILKKWVTTNNASVPLELIWKLNEEEIMFITTYFYINPRATTDLFDTFGEVYSKADESAYKGTATSVLANIVATMVNTLTSHDEKIRTFFENCVSTIILMAIKLLEGDACHGCYLSDVLNSVYIFQECLTTFLRLNLKLLLAYDVPVVEPNALVSIHTKKWSTRSMDVRISYFVSKVLSDQPCDIVIDELKSAIDSLDGRWKYFLITLSVLIMEHNESIPLIKELVGEQLKTGLEENDKESIFRAFIIARHCSAERNKQFPSYISWFGSVVPANPTHFSLFFKFLSELVPYEPPLYLKVHINKVPSAPSGCQNILADYLALAKTRLADLNETTDYLSIFNECYDTDLESLSADVAQLVNHFANTNDIAKPVLEASVFRKQYYEKVFLKFLLRVSATDEPERARAIKKLNTMGKIPNAMYTLWTSL